MKHKCQSSLARCALRRQHPRWVTYPHAGAWVICSPLRGVFFALPGPVGHREVMARVRRAAATRGSDNTKMQILQTPSGVDL